MRPFTIIGIALLLLVASSCNEETYTTKSTVYGIVIDVTDNTNIPIEGALVTNEATGKNCITKADGYYEFQNLQFGKTYKIRAEKNGYISSPKSITPSEIRDRIEVNIEMTRRP